MTVRFRTVGDATCTGAVESPARNPAEVIIGGRRVPHHRARAPPAADDKFNEAAMEDRKKEGYF